MGIRDLALGSGSSVAGKEGGSSARGEDGDLEGGGWGRKKRVRPWAEPGSELRRGLTVAVLKQRGRVVEAAEGRAALRHRPATATAGPPQPQPGPGPPLQALPPVAIATPFVPASPARPARHQAAGAGPGTGVIPQDAGKGGSGHPLPGPPTQSLNRDWSSLDPPRYCLVPPTTGANSL